MPELIVTRRNLPHWTIAGSWYYVTFCLLHGTLNDAERDIVLARIKEGHDRYYRLEAACIMPDHVHLILCPNDDQTLSRVMRLIKGGTSRLVNLQRGARGPLWLEESWDRIIRDDDELQEKLRYMLMNPVEAGLIDDPWMYPWWYLAPE